MIVHFRLHGHGEDCWLVERYCVDLKKETRFLDGLASVAVAATPVVTLR